MSSGLLCNQKDFMGTARLGDAKANTAALFNTKKRLRATIMWKKHTMHCLQNADMDLSRKTGSNTTMIRLQEVHSGEPRN